jgi:chloride channel protein, CIC family
MNEDERDVEQHSTPPRDGTGDVVQQEIQDFIRAHEARRQQFPRALLVGLIAGGVAVLFRWLLFEGDAARDALLLRLHQHPRWGWLVLPIIGAATGSLAGWLTRRYAPEASGSGIPQVKAVLLHLRSLRWQRLLPVKFAAGVIGISGGLTLGREGPTVQMGAAVGQAIAQLQHVPPRSRSTLVAAGAGAGLAAAFNAPLAGFVFVLEELQRDFSPHVFGTALVATVTADVVTRSATGQLPSFHVANYPVPPLQALPLFLILGVLVGLAGIAFNRCLLGALKAFPRLSPLPPWCWPGVAGAICGVVGWFVPGALGGGHFTAEKVLAGQVALNAIPALFLAKFALTMISYGSGAPGGIFAPLLVLGALLGLGVGEISHYWFPHVVQGPAAFAVVGMAAYFAAIVRAPLTGIVLIVDMTGNYQQMLVLLVTCLVAYVVADALGDRPIYEALLERDLRRGQEEVPLEETLLLEVPVQAGAPLVGRLVRELRLPRGCLLVTIRRGTEEFVPHGDTRLQGGDRITAVVTPQASEAVHLLKSAAQADDVGNANLFADVPRETHS